MKNAPLVVIAAASIVLSGCQSNDAPKAAAPDTKANDSWCKEATTEYLKNRPAPEGQPEFVEIRDHQLVESNKNNRSCIYTGVVSDEDGFTEVQTWKIDFDPVKDGWAAKTETPGTAEGFVDEKDLPSSEELSAQNSAATIVAKVVDSPKNAPGDLESAQKHKPFKRALAEGYGFKEYRFESLNDFELCVVHEESGAWASATPAEMVSGKEGATCSS